MQAHFNFIIFLRKLPEALHSCHWKAQDTVSLTQGCLSPQFPLSCSPALKSPACHSSWAVSPVTPRSSYLYSVLCAAQSASPWGPRASRSRRGCSRVKCFFFPSRTTCLIRHQSDIYCPSTAYWGGGKSSLFLILCDETSVINHVWYMYRSLITKSCLTFETPWAVAHWAPLWDFPGKNTVLGAISFSMGSSQPRDWTWVFCIIWWIPYCWGTWGALDVCVSLCQHVWGLFSLSISPYPCAPSAPQHPQYYDLIC